MKRTLPFLLFLISSPSWAICVDRDQANLRKGPSVQHEVTWKVYRFMPFKVIKRKGRWIKVEDLDGEIHWIARSLTTTQFNCAVVKIQRTQTRRGPGKKYQKDPYIPFMDKYTALKLLRVKKGWAELSDQEGYTLWVPREDLWVH